LLLVAAMLVGATVLGWLGDVFSITKRNQAEAQSPA